MFYVLCSVRLGVCVFYVLPVYKTYILLSTVRLQLKLERPSEGQMKSNVGVGMNHVLSQPFVTHFISTEADKTQSQSCRGSHTVNI